MAKGKNPSANTPVEAHIHKKDKRTNIPTAELKDFVKEDLENLATICAEMTYKKDEVIFAEETPGDKMFIIRSGSVKVIKKVKNIENTVNLGTL